MLATASVALLAAPAIAQDTITLEAWTVGPDDPSEPRADNLERAVEALNSTLEEEGADYRVEIETDFDTSDWDSYRRRVLLSFESGDAPDIVSSAHIDVAPWSDAGFIAPLDSYIDGNDRFDDIVPALWDAVTYRGSRWAIPQDTEARPFYYSKPLLAELGWSDEEIDGLPDRIESGDFTWDDVISVGREAVEAGVVEEGRGYWHRPVNGPDFWQFMLLHGATLQDPESGNLVYDPEVGEEVFAMFETMVEEGVLTPDINGMSWNDFHAQTSSGESVLFWSGGTWNWAEWATGQVADRGGNEYLQETIGFALQPQADADVGPLTLSQPHSYMISESSEHKDVAARVLAHVQDPEIERHHFLTTLRPPVLQSSRELPEFEDDWFISRIAYMADYSGFQPLHPSLGVYSENYYRVLTAVEQGEFDAAMAAEILAEELAGDLGDAIEIR